MIILSHFLDAPSYYYNAHFGQGNGTIAIENVACVGTETSLLACTSSPIFGTTCSHSEDAGVACEGIKSCDGLVLFFNSSMHKWTDQARRKY